MVQDLQGGACKAINFALSWLSDLMDLWSISRRPINYSIFDFGSLWPKPKNTQYPINENPDLLFRLILMPPSHGRTGRQRSIRHDQNQPKCSKIRRQPRKSRRQWPLV